MSETCYPYTSGTTKTEGTCYSDCEDHSVQHFYKCEKGSTWTVDKIYNHIEEVRTEIEFNGPIHCSMTVYKDFYAYKDGIY